MYDRHINVITPNLQKGSPSGSRGKESACSAGDTGDMGLIPGLGRSLGEENSNILQYSYVRKPMDRGAWWCRVRGLEKARFRKRTRPALYRNRPPLVSQISELLPLPKKRVSIYRHVCGKLLS